MRTARAFYATQAPEVHSGGKNFTGSLPPPSGRSICAFRYPLFKLDHTGVRAVFGNLIFPLDGNMSCTSTGSRTRLDQRSMAGGVIVCVVIRAFGAVGKVHHIPFCSSIIHEAILTSSSGYTFSRSSHTRCLLLYTSHRTKCIPHMVFHCPCQVGCEDPFSLIAAVPP